MVSLSWLTDDQVPSRLQPVEPSSGLRRRCGRHLRRAGRRSGTRLPIPGTFPRYELLPTPESSCLPRVFSATGLVLVSRSRTPHGKQARVVGIVVPLDGHRVHEEPMERLNHVRIVVVGVFDAVVHKLNEVIRCGRQLGKSLLLEEEIARTLRKHLDGLAEVGRLAVGAFGIVEHLSGPRNTTYLSMSSLDHGQNARARVVNDVSTEFARVRVRASM